MLLLILLQSSAYALSCAGEIMVIFEMLLLLFWMFAKAAGRLLSN
jgi:hypothetical protein